MLQVDITFYERPPEGGKRVRKLAKHSLQTETLLGALDSVRGSIAKSQEPGMIARVARVQIEVSEADTW